MINYNTGVLLSRIDEPYHGIPSKTHIIAIRNVLEGKAYVGYTSNPRRFLGAILCELEAYGIYRNIPLCDFDKLDVIILESVDDRTIAKIHIEYWYDKLIADGYKLYYRHRHSMTRIKITVKAIDKVWVELVYRDRTRLLVGIFSTKPEAKAFVEACYSNDVNPYHWYVYANNIDTRQWLVDLERSKKPIDRHTTLIVDED